MARIIDDAGGELIGYTNRWSTHAGEAVELMVSTTAPSFQASVVRLRHGDPSPSGPGFLASPVPSSIDGTYYGGVQAIRAGSHGVVDDVPSLCTLALWVWPTRPAAGHEQTLLASGGAALFLDAAGRPGLRVAGRELMGPDALTRERWVQIAIVLGADRLALAIDGHVVVAAEGNGAAAVSHTLFLAADSRRAAALRRTPRGADGLPRGPR